MSCGVETPSPVECDALLHLVTPKCHICHLGQHQDPSITPGCDSHGHLCHPGSSWKSLPALGLLVAPDSMATLTPWQPSQSWQAWKYSWPSQTWQPWLPWWPSQPCRLCSDAYLPPAACLVRHAACNSSITKSKYTGCRHPPPKKTKAPASTTQITCPTGQPSQCEGDLSIRGPVVLPCATTGRNTQASLEWTCGGNSKYEPAFEACACG